MVDVAAVFFRIVAMLAVMAVGWAAARRGLLTPDAVRALGRLVVTVTFPALVLVQMLRTVDAPTLRAECWIPLLAIVTLVAAVGLAIAAGRWVEGAGRWRTFAFLAAMPNWIFLPLPIAESLYGAGGVRFVLLYNVGAQLVIWVAAPALLQGRTGLAALRGVALNPGVLATVGGVLVAVLWPDARRLGAAPGPDATVLWRAGAALADALGLLGSLTIPLSLVVTGAQMAEVRGAARRVGRREAALIALRLVGIPAVTLALLRGVAALPGWPLTDTGWVVLTVILSMPIAVSCGMFVERYDGDRALSAQGIVYTTVLSTVTVPLLVLAWRALAP
jgi:predicted permease